MEGLNLIFDRLYGIQLVSVEPHNGEVWAPDVQKLVRFDRFGLIRLLASTHVAEIYMCGGDTGTLYGRPKSDI